MEWDNGGAQNGKVTMGGDFLSCALIDRHPGEVTPHTKTDSITDFYSLLGFFFFSVVFLLSFKFYQEVLLS